MDHFGPRSDRIHLKRERYLVPKDGAKLTLEQNLAPSTPWLAPSALTPWRPASTKDNFRRMYRMSSTLYAKIVNDITSYDAQPRPSTFIFLDNESMLSVVDVSL
nr:hypothetical protein [Tanacetum cinerariifolium]